MGMTLTGWLQRDRQEMGMPGSLLAAVVALGVLAAGSSYAAPAQAAEVCPNETLRQELNSGALPDCRAYEQVTPVFKAGSSVDIEDLSSNGDDVFAASSALLAGADGGGEEIGYSAVYEDRRTASGWQITPMNPPQNEFVGDLLYSVEPDSGLSLWVMHTPEQSANTLELYVRSAGGASYYSVGPLLDPGHSGGEPSNTLAGAALSEALEPAAATSDYGHIALFANLPAVDWPFDLTEGENGSLYEYSGTGNREPIMVGVSGSEKGSRKMLGICGTQLGSGGGRGSIYNALSSDGETIFFTLYRSGFQANCDPADAPPVNEVWARRRGSLISPGAAESVDVSARAPEPACTGACRTSPESGRNFEGASENGERVFFTSTQQLLNAASQDLDPSDSAAEEPQTSTCEDTVGAGGCNLYEYDFDAPAGESLRLIAGGAEVLGVAAIAENGSRVYFVARQRLTTQPRAGGCLEALDAAELAEEELTEEGNCRPRAGERNLYVYDTQEAEHDSGYRPAFIATLGVNDGEDWHHLEKFRTEELTPNGRFLLFPSSRTRLTPGDTASAPQLFEYDAQTGELVRISQGEAGYNENGNGANALGGSSANPRAAIERFWEETRDNRSNEYRSSANYSPIADDGMTVVFTTTGRFSATATSAELGCTSVYEYRSSGFIGNGAVHLISDGFDTSGAKGSSCGSIFTGMDGDGENIFFSTSDPLVSSDTDGGQIDNYDARVDGGFPDASASASCEDAGCEGAVVVAAPPLFGAPPSTSTTGSGNLVEPPAVIPASATRKPDTCSKGRTLSHGKCVLKCPKGKRLLHGRCVKTRDTSGRKVTGARLASRVRGAR
jgi:hypothetical protein